MNAFLFENPSLRRFRRALLIGACLGAAGIFTGPAFAGDDAGNAKPADDADPYPITVEVEPRLVVIVDKEGFKGGRKVAIKGRTLPMGKHPVTISVDSGDPPLHSEFDARVDGKTGAWSNKEFGAVEAGEYEITATAPDGRGSASATLTAVTVPDLSQRAGEAVRKADDAVEKALDDVEKKIDEKPDSPAKDEAKKKIAAARKAHEAYRQADPATAIHGFFGAIYEHDALLEKAAPRLQDAADTVAKIEDQAELIKRMNAELSSADEGCQQMDFAVEFAKALGTALGFEGKLLGQVLGMEKDVAADAASNEAKKMGGPTAGLGASFFVKNAATVAKGQSLVKNAKGITLDFASFGIEQLFNAYCQKFVGPLEATFTGRFYRDVAGQWTMWWRSSYKLSGRMILIYPKSAKGEHVTLAGRIEGYAHSFDTWEKGLAAFDPGLMAGAMVYKKHIPPIDILTATGAKAISQGKGLVSAQVWGSAAGAMIPNSFIMRVRGELDEDTLSIRIGPRIKDFKAEDDVVALIVSPLSAGVGPSVTWYSLPFVDAHSVIAGGAGDGPVQLELKTVGKNMIAKGKVDNKVKTKHAKGEYHLSFKVCNPGC